MYKKAKLLTCCILCFLCFGCGASQMARIKAQHYPTWPPRIQRAVDNHMIIPGMNKLQVQISTEVAENLVKKRTTFIGNSVHEDWILYKSSGMYCFMDPGFSTVVVISFVNGTVESVSF